MSAILPLLHHLQVPQPEIYEWNGLRLRFLFDKRLPASGNFPNKKYLKTNYLPQIIFFIFTN